MTCNVSQTDAEIKAMLSNYEFSWAQNLDIACRVCFPLAFFSFIVIYWFTVSRNMA